MAYETKVGSFNIDTALTATETQAITGVGFTPKLVLFWWGGSTGTSDTVSGGDIQLGFGAAATTSNRHALTSLSEDAVGTSDAAKSSNPAAAIIILSDTTTIDGIMDLSSMDADGFTLVVDDAFTIAARVSYLALGGSDLTNVFIGNRDTPGATGNYATTGVGFQPEFLMIWGQGESSATTEARAKLWFGFATGTANEGCVDVQDNVGTSNANGGNYDTETYVFGDQYADYRGEFVSFDADGFTINHLEGTGTYGYYYLCLAGGDYHVGDILTRTDTNDISETGLGFSPAALLMLSANRPKSNQNSTSAHARISIGAGTSPSERACASVSDEDNLATTETAYANYDSAIYAHTEDDANEGLMDIKSIDADGFTCIMDTVDSAACFVTYVAIGDAAAAAGRTTLNTDPYSLGVGAGISRTVKAGVT